VPQPTAIAMSGGVDSSVAAYLLRKEGHEPVGLFMRTGVDATDEHAADAQRVAAQLGIPLHVLDLSREFEEIIDQFCDEYCRGRTPNPCIVCNRRLKFGRLLEEAQALGAGRLATGHYARLAGTAQQPQLLRGVDPGKDQSYFLFDLAQDQLASALFPNGDRTKADIRRIAESAGLPVKEKAESQEICFVPDNEYRRFLRKRRPDAARKGTLKDSTGATLGEHEGIAFFTIGQRRGLGIAVGEARYVTRIDPDRNEVTVGPRKTLYADRLTAAQVNWVSIAAPTRELRAEAQIRYAHRAAPATLRPLPDRRVEVTFDEPQRAVTPGQAAVFYNGDLLLGGGWIE